MGSMAEQPIVRPKHEPVLYPGDAPKTLPPLHVDPSETPGLFHVDNLTQESADTVSKLLEDNHTAHHIFLLPEHDKGVHHDLTLWSLGATPEQLKEHHHRNTLYQQKPFKATDEGTVKDMTRIFSFKKHLGNEWYYQDYVHFFEHEICQLGYQAVLQKYLVGDNEVAYDILPRMWMGYVHSIMHVGLALEFKQLKVLAEGFAQACVHHDYWYTEFLHKAEIDAAQAKAPALPLSACVDLARANPVIVNCSSVDYQRQFEGEGSQKKFVMRKEMIKDGVCGKAAGPLGIVAARYRVDPNDLERATAELINTAVYTAAASQYPPHECRVDFFLMHGTNASIWHSAFLAEPSLSPAQKARLLEYTGRAILMLYAGMGCPTPKIDWLMQQKPMVPSSADSWDEILKRACRHEDDGHMSKLVRCIAHTRVISEKYDHLPEFRMKQNMFLPAANAALDSVFNSNGGKPMEGILHFDFVRGCAWKEAWEKVPELAEDRKMAVS
ncbi:MAG: hypothetical protein Q9217_001599 [Psora testacea]